MQPRSYLFVPGNRPERFDKALASGADAVVIDLEDAVAPDGKDAARIAVRGWLDETKSVWLRVNGVDTAWFADDLALVRQLSIAGVMLPKAEAAVQVAQVAQALPRMSLLPIIETAMGVWHVLEIARVPQITRLAFGSVDFALDLDSKEGSATFDYARAHIVLASRVARIISPVESVTLTLDDPKVLDADIARARDMGFGAKLCIHPRQVQAVNRGFTPDEAEVAWAKKIMNAVTLSGDAAQLEGKMIDRPVIEQARRILERSE